MFEIVLANGRGEEFSSAEDLANWYDRNKTASMKPIKKSKFKKKKKKVKR